MRTIRSCSMRRYRVEGEVPRPGSAEFRKRLQDRRFRPLGKEEERTYGWASASNFLVTDLASEAIEVGRRAVFALRIDRRRVNAKMLRARLDLEVRARAKAAEDAGGPRRLGREERLQVRKDLQAELLRSTSPSVEAHTVVFDPERRTLSVLSLSRPVQEALRALFRDTFGAELVPLTPWRRAGELLAGTPRAGALDVLERSEFSPGGPDLPSRGVRRVLGDVDRAEEVRP